jgi:hypothetical protein
MQVLSLLAHAWLALQMPDAVTTPAGIPPASSPNTESSTPSTNATISRPVLAIPEDELAGEDEPEATARRGGWSAEKDAKSGGALAIVIGFYRPDMKDINAIAEGLNFPGGFGNDALFMNGLRGYGYIGKHFRIGGMILSGNSQIADPGTQFDRSLELNVNQGGVTLEYVYPTRRMEFYTGGMLGVGNYELTYTQTDLRGTQANWNELLDNFSSTPSTGSFSKSFSAGYTAVNPWVGVKYKLLPWFALDGNVGYHFGQIRRRQWVFSDNQGSGIPGSPSLKASGLTGWLEVTFGFFPY